MKRKLTFNDLPMVASMLLAKVNRMELIMDEYFVSKKSPTQVIPVDTLRPNITPNQIRKLHKSLNGVFESTYEQWCELFSESEIKMSEPIKANSVADVGILMHHLKENRYIETAKYPSVIERAKAFSVDKIPIRAKQIANTKQNMNFPTVGRNFNKINRAVSNL